MFCSNTHSLTWRVYLQTSYKLSLIIFCHLPNLTHVNKHQTCICPVYKLTRYGECQKYCVKILGKTLKWGIHAVLSPGSTCMYPINAFYIYYIYHVTYNLHKLHRSDKLTYSTHRLRFFIAFSYCWCWMFDKQHTQIANIPRRKVTKKPDFKIDLKFGIERFNKTLTKCDI